MLIVPQFGFEVLLKVASGLKKKKNFFLTIGYLTYSLLNVIVDLDYALFLRPMPYF